MKIENLVFSLLVILFAVVMLAIPGWCISFIWGGDFKTTGGEIPSDLQFFGIRVYMGLVLVGFVTGAFKLWDLFYFCMTQAPTNKSI